MAKILVSLVSKQTIPNVRFIKEHLEITGKFIFITTNEMEEINKTQLHLSALNIPQRMIQKIIVDSFSFSKIEETLLKINFNDDDELIVNITGGTKPMSIVAMSFFSAFEKVAIFYVPIGEDIYYQVYPRIHNSRIKFIKKITLTEYFTASGLQLIEQEKRISKNIESAQTLLYQFIETNGDVSKIKKIRKAQKMPNAEDRAYYSGGWFEELIFHKIKKRFGLKENQISYKVKLKNKKSNNEYDAVFIYNDSIYIVECKAYFGMSGLKQKVEKDLYKLAALDDDFGLSVNAIYITTANISGYNNLENQTLLNRAQSLGVKLFQFNDLKNDYFLTKI